MYPPASRATWPVVFVIRREVVPEGPGGVRRSIWFGVTRVTVARAPPVPSARSAPNRTVAPGVYPEPMMVTAAAPAFGPLEGVTRP